MGELPACNEMCGDDVNLWWLLWFQELGSPMLVDETTDPATTNTTTNSSPRVDKLVSFNLYC